MVWFLILISIIDAQDQDYLHTDKNEMILCIIIAAQVIGGRQKMLSILCGNDEIINKTKISINQFGQIKIDFSLINWIFK